MPRAELQSAPKECSSDPSCQRGEQRPRHNPQESKREVRREQAAQQRPQSASRGALENSTERTPSICQQMTSTKTAATSAAPRRGVQTRPLKSWLSRAAEFALETVFILNPQGLLSVLSVKVLQNIFVYGVRRQVETHPALAQTDDPRKVFQSQFNFVKRHDECPLAFRSQPVPVKK